MRDTLEVATCSAVLRTNWRMVEIAELGACRVRNAARTSEQKRRTQAIVDGLSREHDAARTAFRDAKAAASPDVRAALNALYAAQEGES